MLEFTDIYVVSKKRDKETINSFFERFMPEAEPSADEFEFPQYSDDPEVVVGDARKALELCLSSTNIEYRLYWRNKAHSKPAHAMLFFLEDGALIYGLSTETSNAKYAEELFEKLKVVIKSNVGYLAWESAPDVSNYQEFEKEVLANET